MVNDFPIHTYVLHQMLCRNIKVKVFNNVIQSICQGLRSRVQDSSFTSEGFLTAETGKRSSGIRPS